ncbi:MAG: hypothetical protein M1337_04810, partial [Actinobacteria bacterium]|nr:hypothetical protein [Actinomycetota bacterium]
DEFGAGDPALPPSPVDPDLERQGAQFEPRFRGFAGTRYAAADTALFDKLHTSSSAHVRPATRSQAATK